METPAQLHPAAGVGRHFDAQLIESSHFGNERLHIQAAMQPIKPRLQTCSPASAASGSTVNPAFLVQSAQETETWVVTNKVQFFS